MIARKSVLRLGLVGSVLMLGQASCSEDGSDVVAPSSVKVFVKANDVKDTEIVLEDATLIIPAGALAKDTQITGTVIPPLQSVPEAESIDGKAYEFGPDGTTFNPGKEAQLLIKPQQSPPPSDRQATISTLNKMTKRWVDLETGTKGGRPMSKLPHFSLYALRWVVANGGVGGAGGRGGAAGASGKSGSAGAAGKGGASGYAGASGAGASGASSGGSGGASGSSGDGGTDAGGSGGTSAGGSAGTNNGGTGGGSAGGFGGQNPGGGAGFGGSAGSGGAAGRTAAGGLGGASPFQWSQLGGPFNENTSFASSHPSVAYALRSTTVAWQERDHAVVTHFTDAWDALGSPLDSYFASAGGAGGVGGGGAGGGPATASRNPRVVAGSNGPIVAFEYLENATGSQSEVAVTRWANGIWERVGSRPFSVDGAAQRPALVVNSFDGIITVVWYEFSALRAQQFSPVTGVWSSISEPPVAPLGGFGPALAIDADDTIYLTYSANNNAGDVVVFRKAVTDYSWQALGTVLDVTQSNAAIQPTITVDKQGRPVVAWLEGSRGTVYVKRWNKDLSAWEQLGSALSSSEDFVTDVAIAASCYSDAPLVAYNAARSDTNTLYSRVWFNADWTPQALVVPTPSVSSFYPALVCQPETTRFIAAWVQRRNGTWTAGASRVVVGEIP